ncbi:MAG: hypothetical protein LV480_11195 [Methylacidiphilales bacterium]|nr:hypothetical protein [Candidatus Methylacidiphilales bacterium]
MRSPLLFSIAGLWLLLLVVESVRPCFFLHDDNATWFAGAYVHDFRVLTETGRLAEVNFNQYGGEPFLEQGQTAVLYPPVYLGVALAKWVSGDLRWAIEWIAAMHLTLGLVGFYFWLRQGGIAPLLAALGALAWVLNPFVLIVAASWITVTYVAAWLPWLFWAFDRLFARPTFLSAFLLGVIAALFFLQGYVQWVAYSFFFLGLYALYRFVARTEPAPRRIAIVGHLIISALIFLILTLPLLLPMLHAMDVSAARSKPFAIARALDYRVQKDDLVRAQFCLFRPHLIFGMSTAILYCPALLLLPVMILRFFHAGTEVRQKLFPLLILSLLALFFSSRWHLLLSMLPLFEKFRWPFKVFVLADFFLLASLVWAVSSWTGKRPGSPNVMAAACLAFVLLAGVAVSLSCHDGNTFSRTTLPVSDNPPPTGMDPALGRVIAIDNLLPEASSHRFFTHCYSTFFDVPSLGGYDPLVGRAQLRFALGLDFPNVFYGSITPEMRDKLAARAVRYWIVDPHSPQLQEVEALGGLKRLATETDRVVFEDTQASPLAYSEADPSTPCPVTYSGNSMLVSLGSATSPVEISVGPTDGWWYRIDQGPWNRPAYQDDRLKIDFPKSGRVLEISYFDSRFREGLRLSAYLFLILGLLFIGGRLFRRRIERSRPS